MMAFRLGASLSHRINSLARRGFDGTRGRRRPSSSKASIDGSRLENTVLFFRRRGGTSVNWKRDAERRLQEPVGGGCPGLGGAV